MVFFKRLSIVGVFNSILCSITLLVVIVCNIQLLTQLDNCSDNNAAKTIQIRNHPQSKTHPEDQPMDPIQSLQDLNNIHMHHSIKNSKQKQFGINLYLSSFRSNMQPIFNPLKHNQEAQDCIVLLSDENIINSTLGALYNIREPSLGNWSDCIIVIAQNIKRPQFDYAFRYFNCLNVYHMDITNDPLKSEFSHVHYLKNYILLHPFFRGDSSKHLFRYIMYLDSDCITVKPMRELIDRAVKYMYNLQSTPNGHDKWIAWREDYRHQSMYKAVLDLNKYSESVLAELKEEYPDYVESKQGNVMLFDMKYLPSVEWFKDEINRIMDKYSVGFWRNDQSLFNLLLYHNSTELGWTAFTHPPSEQLFYPPDRFPMVHTGGHEAMYHRRPINERGGIERKPEKAFYHSLWEFWMFKLLTECPPLPTEYVQ